MKVDYTRPTYGTTGSYAVDTTNPRSSTQVSTGTPASDSLSISGDVGLAKRAMEAISQSSGNRPEAVARGKALVESGKAGTDVEAISDALISRLLESWRMD